MVKRLFISLLGGGLNGAGDGFAVKVLAMTEKILAFTEIEVMQDPQKDSDSRIPVKVIARNSLIEYSVANQLGLNSPFGADTWPGEVNITLVYPGYIFELPYSTTFYSFNYPQQSILLEALPKEICLRGLAL